MGFNADVIVVGAGFAGLSAARELMRRGVACIVLEKQARVGGRTESRINGLGEKVDTGGQFYCIDMPEITRLVDDLGIARIETPFDGDSTTYPPLEPVEIDRISEAGYAIRERMVALADDLDAVPDISMAEWLDAQPDEPAAKRAFRSQIEGLWCQELSDLPLWFMADNDRRITNEVMELQYYPQGTMQGVAEKLATELGERVRLGKAVERIAHDADGVTVEAGGVSLRARRVIVSVPPVIARAIRYEPALPHALRAALAVWKTGSVIKVVLRYGRRFWREAGRGGVTMWPELPGLFACEESPDPDHPTLVLFIGGPLALKWRGLGNARLREQILGRLGDAHGTWATQPLDMTIRDWTDDPNSGGGYADTVADMTARDAEKVLRDGAGPIRFAASELSPSFPGYVEGAIVIGRLVASDVADGL